MTRYIEITKAELKTGGNIIRQGAHFRQGYVPRDAAGAEVNLAGKTIRVAIYTKQGGVRYEGPAEYDPGDKQVYYVVNENIGYGTMWAEFTVTDPNDANYRMKFPSNEQDAKMQVIRGIDDLDFAGVPQETVEAFRKEFDEAVGAMTVDSEVVLARKDKSTLAQRLDADKAEVTAQLAETEVELTTLSTNKMDKNTSGISVSQIDKNKGKFDQTFLTDALLQQIAGTAPINATPADKSLTLGKFADTLSQMVNINGYKIFGGVTKLVKHADFSMTVSTTDFVVFSEDGTKKWAFAPVTNQLLNQRDILVADLTLAQYSAEPHPLQVLSNGESVNILGNKLPVCANYWGRFFTKATYQSYEKFNQIDANTTEILNIKANLDSKCFFEKTGDSIFMYKPSKTDAKRFFKLGYQRDLDAIKNADVWRIFGAWVVEKNGNVFTNKIELHDQAEWEGVFLEAGKTDFSGGWHGDEKTQWINVWVDGQKIDMTLNHALKPCKKIEIVSATKMNRMGVPAEILMDRTKRLVFDAESFTVDNRFKAVSVFTIADFYATMCGVLQKDWKFNGGVNTFHYGMKDTDWLPQDSNNPVASNPLSTPETGVKTMKLYSNTHKIVITVSSISDKNDYPNQNGFIQTVPYPKIYFHLTGGYTTKLNELFRVKSIYEIEV